MSPSKPAKPQFHQRNRNAPTVSVGIPVYNGERFITDAIESVLEQTYADLEVIVLDNQSQDRTVEICSEYAAGDDRVRIHSNRENIGPVKNFRRVLDLSSGAYFKWLAADDVIHSRFLETCVEILNHDESVEIATTHSQIIDEVGAVIPVDPDGFVRTQYGETWKWNDFPLELTEGRPSARFGAVIRAADRNLFTELFFGLMRRDSLDLTADLATHISAEKALLAELILRGTAKQADEVYLYRRLHAEHEGGRGRLEYLRRRDAHRRAALLRSPFEQFNGYSKAIRRVDVGSGERFRSYAALLSKLASRETARQIVKPGPSNALGIGRR